MLMPIASSAKKTAWKPRPALPATASASKNSLTTSAHPDAAAQDPLGPDDQDDDQQQQPADVLDVVGDDQRRHLHEDADDEAADQGAVGRAQTAQRDAGEHEQQQPEAHVPLHLVGQTQE